MQNSHPPVALRWLLILVPALLVSATVCAQDCIPVDHTGAYESRFGRADSARDEQGLRELLENPVFLEATTNAPGSDGAVIETVTDTHAVYPVAPADIMAVLTDDSRLASFIPDLEVHELRCSFPGGRFRQYQRIEMPVLFLTVTSEYTIDIEHVRTGPDVYSARWVLHESLDGQTAYLYGSWYYEPVEIDGQPMTYARYYSRLGLATAVPGARFVIPGQLEPRVSSMFQAFYDETVRRFGRTITP